MATLSPNPNIYDTPNIQPSQCVEWSATGTYTMGDCVLRGATFDVATQRWVGGEMFYLLALVGNRSTPGQICYVGATSDPLNYQLSLSNPAVTGVDFNNGWISSTNTFSVPPPAPNPGGAQWVNMTLLSPAVRPWNKLRAYNQGDLVYYPDPTVVWRASFDVVTGSAPNVAGLNQKATSQYNQGWALISNPQQYTAFNPTQFSVEGTSVNEPLPQPLPPTRALPL